MYEGTKNPTNIHKGQKMTFHSTILTRKIGGTSVDVVSFIGICEEFKVKPKKSLLKPFQDGVDFVHHEGRCLVTVDTALNIGLMSKGDKGHQFRKELLKTKKIAEMMIGEKILGQEMKKRLGVEAYSATHLLLNEQNFNSIKKLGFTNGIHTRLFNQAVLDSGLGERYTRRGRTFMRLTEDAEKYGYNEESDGLVKFLPRYYADRFISLIRVLCEEKYLVVSSQGK